MGKTIELSRVRQSEHSTLDGVEWVKLDETHMGAFVVSSDVLPDNCPFESDDDREDANNFCDSHIVKEMERWLQDQHKPISDATSEWPVDLTTMDGMTDYGTPLVVTRLLAIDDHHRYRRPTPSISHPSWLATGWTTKNSPSSNGGGAYTVCVGDIVDGGYVYYAYSAPRPASYLKSSIFVSIEVEEEQKSTRDYTDTELMDESYRRRRVSYDLDWAERTAAP